MPDDWPENIPEWVTHVFWAIGAGIFLGAGIMLVWGMYMVILLLGKMV